jgi:2-hydroxy-3-keto-5-methylthiopentenyl-1-phosphate phosphatase
MEQDQKPIEQMNDGIAIVLQRMETHPEEFFGTVDKWKFIFKDYFRDSMTETEKGLMFDKMKRLRRAEFTSLVMQTILVDAKMKETTETEQEQSFRKSVIKGSNQKVNY